MSYARQDTTARQLQKEGLQALDALEQKRWLYIEKEWRATRMDLRALVVDVYRRTFGTELSDIAIFNGTGMMQALWQGLHDRLMRFKDASALKAKQAFNDLYRESVLRHAYVLDMTSPPSFKVRIPHRLRLFEAGGVSPYGGNAASVGWGHRWGAWVDAYESALQNNLRLGAINNSSALDAADEVDATRAGTPNYGLLDSLQRIYSYESVWAISKAAQSVSDVNEQLGVKEIWQTRDDADVDEDCMDNEGLGREDADGEIPLHPNCRCYWRIVPKTWVDLLKNGTDDDRALALAMDSKGLVPNSMVIADEDGNIAAHVVVTFQDWLEGQARAVVGR